MILSTEDRYAIITSSGIQCGGIVAYSWTIAKRDNAW